MKLLRLLSLSLVLLMIFAASAQAEWWKPRMPSMPSMSSMPSMPRMPSINPFKWRDSHPASIAQKDEGTPWLGTHRPAKQQEEVKPSMWQRVNSSTKSTWTKTTGYLTPWRSQPQPEEELVITGPNSSFSRMANSSTRQPTKKAYWAWGNEEEDRPQKASSVSDFIGGRRPE